MSENVDTEQFNADELQAPEWLNSEFITEVLSKYENVPELKVTDLQISPASAQGDHYASVMFRAKAEYTTPKGKFSKPLIIKTMPELEGHKKDMLSESYVFTTEIGTYCTALPEFERILREAGDKTKLYVPCLYHSMEPRQVMIFEDLVPLGYSVIRGRPVTEEELKKVFAKLAKWHAVSMKVLNERPNFLADFKYGIFEMPTIKTDPFVTTGMARFIEMLDQKPEFRKYKPHFEKVKDVYLDRLADEMQEYRKNRSSDGYYVLCHGDFHLRNMMFKENKQTGAPEDVMLVDFQFCNICPITVDLTYSIYMLMEPEQRRDMGKEMIHHYFTVLVETLKKIGYKAEMPTEARLWEQIHRNRYYHFFMISTLLPMMLALKSNALKMNDLIQDPETRKKSYLLENYLKDVELLLPKYEELGHFKDL
ncbi:hypothetical protein KR200_007244 [Drosophila serrata]|nr:hypothetical protein KR200_007244 [Drosophila serrata]